MKKINYKNIIYILLGSMIFSIGIEWFASPNKLVNGGASGVAIIITNVIKNLTSIEVPISVLVLIINIPLFIFGFIIKGKKFVQNSIFATVAMTIWLAVFHKIPPVLDIQNDILLATILTGVLCGVGTGIILKVGASSGGTDMLANIINKLIPHISISKIIFAADTTIVLVGFLIFGPVKAMYGIITIFISSRLINSILGGLRFARAVFIVSEKAEEISKEVFKKLERGTTNLPCTGMYTKKQKNLLVVVLMPKELIKLKNIIESVDNKAFIIITPAQEVVGNGF